MYSNSATRWLYILGKGLLIILIVVTFAANCFEQRRQLQEAAKLNNQNGSLLGDYEIEAFILNGEVVPPGERDTQRWKKIVIKGEKTVNIQYMDGTSGPWHFNISGNNTKIIIHSWDLSSTGNFTAQADDVALTIEGVLDKNNIKVICRKSSEGSGDSFLLVNRGFHWVNEYPFNK